MQKCLKVLVTLLQKKSLKILYKLTSGISKLLKISILFAQKKGKSKVEEAFSFVTTKFTLSNLRIAPKSNSFEDCCSKISPISTNQPILPYFAKNQETQMQSDITRKKQKKTNEIGQKQKHLWTLYPIPRTCTIQNHSKPYDTQKQQIEYINFDKHMHDQTWKEKFTWKMQITRNKIYQKPILVILQVQKPK